MAFVWIAVAMNHSIEVCSHCRHSVKVLFEDVGFYFHWVGDIYCIDVFLVFEDAVILLFGERWVLGKEHERKRMRRG